MKAFLSYLDPNDKKELMLKALLRNKKFKGRVASEPQYSVNPFELKSLSILKESFPRIRINNIEYTFCYDCGCMFDSSLFHCKVCHSDYEPHSSQTHVCRTITPSSRLIHLLKRNLSILEMTISLKMMSKEQQQTWNASGKGAWDLKCKDGYDESLIVKRAQSPFELLACLLIIERIVPIGG